MTQIKLRRDTAANWATANSVLAQGEPAIDTTNLGIKVGDGTTAWSNLKFLTGGQPSPSITFVGTPLGLPTLWKYTPSAPVLQYSSNNSFLTEGSGYYWLDQRFDNGDADYSGVSEAHLNNIGGLTDYFQWYKKYEDSLTTIDLGNISYISNWFNIGNFSNTLTTFTANSLVEVVNNFEINNMHTDNGVQFVFPALQKTNSFYIDNNWNMANTISPSFPSLNKVYSVYIYYNQYSSWSNFSNLQSISWEIQFHNNSNPEAADWACPGFPAIVTVPGYVEIYSNDYMTSIPAFSSLTTVGNSIDIFENHSLLLYPAFPLLQHVGSISGYNNYSVTGFDGGFFPSLKTVNGNVNFSTCSLTESAVDELLAKLVSLDGTNGTANFTGAVYVNGSGNAIPSAQGMTDIATLQGRGCYVEYNS
jgi:hypothetical protein